VVHDILFMTFRVISNYATYIRNLRNLKKKICKLSVVRWIFDISSIGRGTSYLFVRRMEPLYSAFHEYS